MNDKQILFVLLFGPEFVVIGIMIWIFGRLFLRLRKDNREHRARMLQIKIMNGKVDL